MSQTSAIILRFPDRLEFERLFKAEVLPLWRKFKSEGKFLGASPTPIQGGMTARRGVRHYILHVEVAGMAEREGFDSHRAFTKFLGKAQAMRAADPLVWLGES